MIRTLVLVLMCAALLGGCAQTPDGAARTRAVLGGLADMNSGPDPVVEQMNQRRAAQSETECVSERRYDGKVVTNCKAKQ